MHVIDVTEDEIRRSMSEVLAQRLTPEARAAGINAIVTLWKKGAILPVSRKENGDIVWVYNPDFNRELLKAE